MNAISGWQIEQVMSVAQSFAQRLRDEGMDDESVALALESETEALETLERVVRMALDAEAMAEAATARIADLAERRARFDRQASDARGVAFAIMDALNIPKHVAADFTLSIRAGAPSVAITDEAKLPESAWKVTRSIDKAAIRAALKSGAAVPGAEMAAGMPSLSVRTR